MLKSIVFLIVNLLCTTSSYSPVVVFYFVSNLLVSQSGIEVWLQIMVLALLSLCCFMLAIVALEITKAASTNDSAEVRSIRPIENNAMPTYIGLFVISLGINNLEPCGVLFVLFVLFIMWRRFERTCYFNPLWSLLGWYFYELQTKQDGTFFLVTQRKDLKDKSKLENLKRINNYTFMEIN